MTVWPVDPMGLSQQFQRVCTSLAKGLRPSRRKAPGLTRQAPKTVGKVGAVAVSDPGRQLGQRPVGVEQQLARLVHAKPGEPGHGAHAEHLLAEPVQMGHRAGHLVGQQGHAPGLVQTCLHPPKQRLQPQPGVPRTSPAGSAPRAPAAGSAAGAGGRTDSLPCIRLSRW